jgi:F-type H+-transporting ATPase subunit epsilon
MLPENIQLRVVTPEREVLETAVDFVELPGSSGYLGVLPGHAPLITELGVGHLNYRRGPDNRFLSVLLGYAEVLPDRVIVLAEIAERPEEIDVERAHRARDRAQAFLAKAGAPGVDWARAASAWQRAMARLYVAGQKAGYIGTPEDGPRS